MLFYRFDFINIFIKIFENIFEYSMIDLFNIELFIILFN